MDFSTVKSMFNYCEMEKSRPLVRSVSTNYNAKVGHRVGTADRHGYLRFGFKGKTYAVHRIVFFYHNGYLPLYVDHINGDILDNRISNLREATSSENNCNAKLSKNNNSGVKGVSLSRGKWLSQIMKDGKRLHLYYGDSKDDAIKARLDAEVVHGRFSRNKGRNNGF